LDYGLILDFKNEEVVCHLVTGCKVIFFLKYKAASFLIVKKGCTSK
jgi:hypothetical protein